MPSPFLIPWEERLSKRYEPPFTLWFFGSPALATSALSALWERKGIVQIQGVVTAPDRPRGRGWRLAPTPVAELASSLGLPLYKPEKLSELRRHWEENPPDLFLVFAYGKIFPEWALLLPRIAPLNLHASLLPRHRGANPIPHMILAGDEVGGVTLMGMEPELDAGPILFTLSFPLTDEDDAGTVEKKITALVPELLHKSLGFLGEGKLQPQPQDPSCATYAPKLTRAERRIPWHLPAKSVDRVVRAFAPSPGAFSILRGEELKILKGRVVPPHTPSSLPPGTLLPPPAPHTLIVACGEGTAYEILTLQPPGKRVMSAEEFLRGRSLHPGERLE